MRPRLSGFAGQDVGVGASLKALTSQVREPIRAIICKVSPNPKKPGLPEGLMRLSAAAEAGGVSKQTIEYYLALQLLRPIRLPGRFGRFFDEALVRRIRLIRRLNRTGLPLRDIREIYFKGR